MSINVFFFLASSLTMGYRAGRENLWPKYAAAFSSSTFCSLFNRIHKKNIKRIKNATIMIVLPPFPPSSDTFSEVWHNENSGNSGCALWFRRRRRRKRKFEKAHKSFYEIMIRKFFLLSLTQLEAKNRLNAFSLLPRLLLYKWALLSVRLT